MNKNDQINMLIRQIGDLIKKQSDQVLWEEPNITVYADGRMLDIEEYSYSDGELIIHVCNDGGEF